MTIENKIFHNQFSEKRTNDKRFSAQNENLFFDNFKKIFEWWSEYLELYADNTKRIFNSDEPEYPWMKFEEPTWVSSLAVSIAKKARADAILIEEIPVTKRGNKTKNGNADLWCCLKGDPEFSFYLEAKFSPWAKRSLNSKDAKPLTLKELGTEISTAGNGGLISRIFRDFQKSSKEPKADKTNYITHKSPHGNEKNRKHNHVFVSLIIKPVQFEGGDWREEFDFSTIFNEDIVKIYLATSESKRGSPDSYVSRNIYNIPIYGMVMRETTSNTGFITFVVMLGEADDEGKKS